MRKNKFIFLLFTILVLCISPLFAAPFDMILVGDPVLEDLLFLSRESGNAFLSFTPPLAPGEIKQFLESIDPSSLPEPAQEAYNRITKRLTPAAPLSLSSENFSLNLHINLTLEAMARFNKDISWYPEYPKIPALLSFPLSFYFSDCVQLYIEPLVSKEPQFYPGEDSLAVNIPFNWSHLDTRYPLKAFIAAGGPWWNFQLGRDRVSYGTGHTGSLSISDNPAYYEFARLSFFSRFFRYSVLINQMPFQVPEDLYNDVNNYYHSLYPDRPDILKRSNQRNYYLHRLDFTFRDVLSVGLMEGVMVGNSAMELRYLNPLMIFHSFYSWWQYDYWTQPETKHDMNGAFASLEVNWNIMKSLSVYGQFFLNEFATPLELADKLDQPPNGMGYMAGVNYTHSFTNWGAEFFFEFVYTDPYAYMNPTPFASFIYNLSKLEEMYYYIGYPRDIITCTLGGRFFRDDRLSVSGKFSWISQGEHTIDWDWDTTPAERNERTPSGIAENKFIASVEARWKPLSYLVLKGSLTGIVALNNEHKSGSTETGGQAALSVSFLY